MPTSMQPFAGTYELDPAHSTIQFAVRHQQIATFRSSFGDVDVQLKAEDGTIALEGQARVASISIATPPELREHVVRGTDFFDADSHPNINFRSTDVELAEDGTATVSGELSMRGVTRTITARGTYHATQEDPFGSYRAGLALGVTVDRRAWNMNWQLPLPEGGDALGWDVEITVELELIKKS